MKKILIILSLFIISAKLYGYEYDPQLKAIQLEEEDYTFTFENIESFLSNSETLNSIKWQDGDDIDQSDMKEYSFIWIKLSISNFNKLNKENKEDYDAIEINEKNLALIAQLHGHNAKIYINEILQKSITPNSINKNSVNTIFLNGINENDNIIFKINTTLYGEFNFYFTNAEYIKNNPNLFLLNSISKEIFDIIVSIIILSLGIICMIIFLKMNSKEENFNHLLLFSLFAIMLGLFHALSTDIIITFLPVLPVAKETIEMALFDILSILLVIFYINYFQKYWKKLFYVLIAGHILLLISNILCNISGYFLQEREIISFFYPGIEYFIIWLHLSIKVKKQFPSKYFRFAFIIIAVTYILQSDLIFGSAIADNSFNVGLISFFTILGFIPIISFLQKSDTIKKQNIIFQKFVPIEFLNFLSKDSITQIQLGDQIKADLTILFTDIRSFTEFTENSNPDAVFQKLNTYLKIMGPIIRKYNGFIDKYIGDAILALFPDNPKNAIDAGIEMLDALKKNKEIDFNIGIGIHSGPTMLGIIGEEERIESTVISDTVNTASRIESLTKELQCPLLFSESVAKVLDSENTIDLGNHSIRGKKDEVRLFTLKEYKS